MFKFRIHHNRGVGAMACHTSKFFFNSYHFSQFFPGRAKHAWNLVQWSDPVQFIRIGRLVLVQPYLSTKQTPAISDNWTFFLFFFSEFLKMNEKIDEGLKETPSTCYLQSCVLPRVKQCVYSNRMVFRLRHEFIWIEIFRSHMSYDLNAINF